MKTISVRPSGIQRNPYKPNDYIVSETGKTFWKITSIRRSIAAQGPGKVTLSLERTRKADVVPNATIHPIPADAPKAAPEPPAPPRKPPPRQSRAQAQDAQRDHVSELLADDAAMHAVPSIRVRRITGADGIDIRGPTARPSEWRDPDDDNPRRREPLKVRGFRRACVLETIRGRGSPITMEHMIAADLLLNAYELGELGARPGWQREMNAGLAGYSSGSPPSELRLIHLRAYEAVKVRLGRSLFPILDHVVLKNRDLTSYAKKRRVHRHAAVGILIAALDTLVDHYEAKIKEISHPTTEGSHP